jgi:hypothetical protein
MIFHGFKANTLTTTRRTTSCTGLLNKIATTACAGGTAAAIMSLCNLTLERGARNLAKKRRKGKK